MEMALEDGLARSEVGRQNLCATSAGSYGAETTEGLSSLQANSRDGMNDHMWDAQLRAAHLQSQPSSVVDAGRMGNSGHGAGGDLIAGSEPLSLPADLANNLPRDVGNGMGLRANADIPAHSSSSSSETDDDEDEDRNWEPFDMLQLQARWFCTNCTRLNFDEASNCLSCGEHRSSGILTQGFLAAPHLPSDFTLPQDEPASNGSVSREIVHGSSNGGSAASSCVSGKRTAIGYDERMLLHAEFRLNTSPHPERPDRLRAIVAGLAAAGLFPGRCFPIPAREISRQELELVHTKALVDHVERTSGEDVSHFTPDTYANKHSSLAARLAAGTCADLATSIVSGQLQNGFALVRPPGHHAEEGTCMGFCLHNNAAVAARVAQQAGAQKILILDWDVHHGNGTQEIFESDPTVLFISLHRHDRGFFYPGTGTVEEVGSGPGTGFSVNIPWNEGGIGDDDYIAAFHHVVLPIARQFSPDFTIISAGFDAARGDPLGGCKVSPTGYAEMTRLLQSLAGGKILAILEGGYNLRSISASATAVVKVLLGDNQNPVLGDVKPTRVGAKALLQTIAVHSKYWSDLHVGPALERAAEAHSVWCLEFQQEGDCRKTSDLGADNALFGKHVRRSVVGGPKWWLWGRKKLLYHHWFLHADLPFRVGLAARKMSKPRVIRPMHKSRR